tara:strand:- start:150 stop:728 length:579 start_codon:yes stop_codon:yes gene_type:complete
MEDTIRNSFQDSIDTKKLFIDDRSLVEQVEKTAEKLIACLNNKGKIFFAGNGGSFADSQHLTAEFISRFLFDRDSLPAIALGTNNSNISAIGNDYGYDFVFSREISALGSPNDVFIPISTSGNSKNIILAAKEAMKIGLEVIGLTGKQGGSLSTICECIKVPSDEIPRIQECHILIGHILCQISEERIFKHT